ncbi:MAG TPA: hypothetical protein VEX67_14735 [Solirubrobacteraceae bacterium]|nr:hypothetical protein [Solirubrobacteraceae bacterium]
MTDLIEQSATWMARAVREREVSAMELLDAHAARSAPAPRCAARSM